MGLPGVDRPGEQSYPEQMREALSALPFRKGSTTTLGVAGTPEDLVLVSALRRFEGSTFVATGTHTGANNATSLTSSAGNFVQWGVEPGDIVRNTTDGSQAVATGVSATNVAGTLAGGTQNDWDTGDAYEIDKAGSLAGARASIIKYFAVVSDKAVYIRFDGPASSTRFDVRLAAGETRVLDRLRVVSRISFVNEVGGETPALKWSVQGL